MPYTKAVLHVRCGYPGHKIPGGARLRNDKKLFKINLRHEQSAKNLRRAWRKRIEILMSL